LRARRVAERSGGVPMCGACVASLRGLGCLEYNDGPRAHARGYGMSPSARAGNRNRSGNERVVWTSCRRPYTHMLNRAEWYRSADLRGELTLAAFVVMPKSRAWRCIHRRERGRPAGRPVLVQDKRCGNAIATTTLSDTEPDWHGFGVTS